MQVGHSARDISPPLPGLMLSGFAARCDQPSTGLDDPIEAHALAFEQDCSLTIVLVFDLLGLGPELTASLRRGVLAATRDRGWREPNLILCCTHTHSAPATIKLLGCGIPESGFWSQVERLAAEAALEAIDSLQPAVVRYSLQDVTGVSYNRHKVLADGRVVMSSKPDQAVLRSGPTWDRALLVRFDTEAGRPIAGLLSWAAHPCVVCTSNVSADYPGELRRSLGNAFGFPLVFVQGPCGNINLPFQEMNRAEMLESVRKIMPQLSDPRWSPPNGQWPVQHAARQISLQYASGLSAPQLQEIRDGMARISKAGKGPESTMRLLADILNVEPGSAPDPALVRHIAAAIHEWSSAMLENVPASSTGYDLAVDVVRLGPLWFTFVAAELFAETGLALQERFPELIITPVGYGSPLAGYLPTDEALADGGYEVEYAYRFYGHPASFAAGSEPLVRKEIEEMILSMEGKCE